MTLNILLADDNQTFLVAVRHFLDLLPGTCVVAEAHDGREALTQAARLQPDLMLLDVAMPELTGLEVARVMRGWSRKPSIVFLSMFDSAVYRELALELGARGFVGKGDFVQDLVPIIEQIASEKTACIAQEAS